MSATALYPGTFDVVTFGHLDLIRRAVRLFDKVIVAVADNPSKKETLFSVQERAEMLRAATAEWSNVEVATFPGLTVDFAAASGASAILRGLRAVSDFEFEFQMAMMNENLAPNITTMFLAPAPQLSFVSSSLVKEIARFGGDISHFVPATVETAVREKMQASGSKR